MTDTIDRDALPEETKALLGDLPIVTADEIVGVPAAFGDPLVDGEHADAPTEFEPVDE